MFIVYFYLYFKFEAIPSYYFMHINEKVTIIHKTIRNSKYVCYCILKTQNNDCFPVRLVWTSDGRAVVYFVLFWQSSLKYPKNLKIMTAFLSGWFGPLTESSRYFCAFLAVLVKISTKSSK